MEKFDDKVGSKDHKAEKSEKYLSIESEGKNDGIKWSQNSKSVSPELSSDDPDFLKDYIGRLSDLVLIYQKKFGIIHDMKEYEVSKTFELLSKTFCYSNFRYTMT